jgi:hypothetical protein
MDRIILARDRLIAKFFCRLMGSYSQNDFFSAVAAFYSLIYVVIPTRDVTLNKRRQPGSFVEKYLEPVEKPKVKGISQREQHPVINIDTFLKTDCCEINNCNEIRVCNNGTTGLFLLNR